MRFTIFTAIIIGFLLSSCTNRYDVMFKDIKNFEYSELMDTYNEDYVLAPDDIISFRLYTRDGLQIIQRMTGTGNNENMQNERMMMNQGNSRLSGFSYVIEADGSVNLPMLDRVKLGGKTLKEAEFFLEDLFAKYYVDPYVQIDVNNQRVIVSPGAGNMTQVVTLANRNTTVFEAIALAGGISPEGNAKKIRLIRKNEFGEYDVYKLNLSTLEGLPEADMVVQANDIIYVQPTRNFAKEFVTEFAPYLTLLSNAILIYSLIGTN